MNHLFSAVKKPQRSLISCLFTMTACLFLLFYCGDTWLQDAYSAPIAKNVLRLHILANSDSHEDQAIKLQVRDGVLHYFSQNLPPDTPREEAENWTREHEEEILSLSRHILEENHCSDSVSLSINDAYFPVRAYGSLTFPCGMYRALRITIGSGSGHNWWCILSPGICRTISGDRETTDILPQTLGEEYYERLNPGGESTVSYRSWIADFIGSFF